MNRRTLLRLSASAAAWAGFARAASAEDTEIRIDNFTFNPAKLTVKVGTTVTWINSDDIPHNIVSKVRAFRSKTLDTDDRFVFTFTIPGIYEYFCALHPHMTGTIVVEGAPGSGATQ
ncbi:MAG: cupredoxin family copper-binding protein [Pseudomonadota bacterium]